MSAERERAEKAAGIWAEEYIASHLERRPDPHCEKHHWEMEDGQCSCIDSQPSLEEMLVAFTKAKLAGVEREAREADAISADTLAGLCCNGSPEQIALKILARRIRATIPVAEVTA